MGRINNAGAKAKAERLISSIRSSVASRLPEVAEVMMADVSSRAPTKEEEYDTLMRGDGNPENVDLVPLAGDRSGDSDNRIRLIKEAGSWIQDIIRSFDNVVINTARLSVMIGTKLRHGLASNFQFQNADGSWHRVGPYFNKFEYGSIDVVVEPRLPAAHGGKYPLRPDENPDKKLFRMYKPIRARAMYSPTYLRKVVRSKLEEILSQVGRGRSNLT